MRSLPVILLSLLFAASPGAAQTLRGRLVDVDSVTPVASAIVLLQDSAGRTMDKGVSNDAGRFQLRAVAPGTFALRVLRIGYAPWQAPVTLAAGQVLERSLLLNDARIDLPEVRVEGTGVCVNRADSDSLGIILWGQASTALTLAKDGLRSRHYRFETVLEDRMVDSTGLLSQALPASGVNASSTAWPVQSLPPDSLLRYGFITNREDLVEGPTWFGPDADFLLSESFVAGHCLRSVPATPGLPAEWIGVSFEPANRSRLADIRGTLWLDRASVELRRIDYGYTQLPSWAHGRDASGSLGFVALRDGGWVVQRWSMRVPVPKVNTTTRVPGFYGYRESGGRVVAVLGPGGEVVQRFTQ